MNAVIKFAEAGEEVRITTIFPIPFKMYIFDEKTVMFTLQDITISGTKLTALIIEHQDLVRGLKSVFNLYWTNSIPLEKFLKKDNKE
jgi:hypothetical protein